MDSIEKYHFYINLRERTKKNKNTIEELKRFGISKPNRFEAIPHEIGLVGCVKSHIRCIELAKERDYPFVCIFEDDIVFRQIEKCQEMIHKYINYDYDVLYLGAWVRDNQYEFINKELIHINYACCSHSYIIKNHYYDTLLKNYYESMELKIENKENNSYNIDEYTIHLQRVDKWYCFYPHFVSQKDGYSDNFYEDRNYCDLIFKIPIHDSLLPHISVLTPTCDRKKFLPLMIYNIHHFTYPKEKIEWYLLESNDNSVENYEKIFNDKDEIKYLEQSLGIKIKYEYIDDVLSIGKKRNRLSDNSSHEYLINMDDDDLYLPSYLNHNIDILTNTDKEITGCLDMLFIYPQKDYQISYIKCVRDFKLYHEATLCMTKTYFRSCEKYEDSNKGEGENIYRNSEFCCISNVTECMICVCWDGNTVNKDRFLDYRINMDIQGDSLNILKKIFEEDNKMESIKEEDKQTLEISTELLQNIRNLIEVTNTRVNWKLEELLPVGVMIKQIDELLESSKKIKHAC